MKKIRGMGLWVMGLGLVIAGCDGKSTSPSVSKPLAPVEPATIQKEELPTVRFVDVTEASGLKFVHVNGAKGKKLLPETMGSGVAVLDYDGDGDPDLFFVNSDRWPDDPGGPRPTQALYRNDGKGNFTDVSKEAGLDVTFFGMGAAVGDYDNDGDPDLYVTALGGGHLFRNDGGTFVDVTESAHAKGATNWPTSAAFFDMENDGDLDLFICQYVNWSPQADRGISTNLTGTEHPAYDPPTAYGGSFCVLLRNDGGTFVDVSESSGIQVRTPDLKAPVAKALGVAPFDVDGDGLVDLAVANDTVRNFLFRNLGGVKFEEIGMRIGVAHDANGTERAGMGTDWSDFKNDGSVALAVGNFANEMAAFYVADSPAGEPGRLVFADLASTYGLGASTQPPLKFGLFFFDYDLDGRADLLLANGHLESDIAQVQRGQSHAQPAQLYWNTGESGRALFALVLPQSAGPDLFQPIVGRGSAYLDMDGDGDLDVVLTANGGPARLFRNEGGDRNHRLRLTLKGSASNRDGIGARVTVRAGTMTQTRQAFPAKGYLSSVEAPLTFGLGRATTVDRVSIVWPSRRVTELENVPADRPIEATEPK